jgi:hypothetical protein
VITRNKDNEIITWIYMEVGSLTVYSTETFSEHYFQTRSSPPPYLQNTTQKTEDWAIFTNHISREVNYDDYTSWKLLNLP